jgi:hypothetical protein
LAQGCSDQELNAKVSAVRKLLLGGETDKADETNGNTDKAYHQVLL